MLLVQHALKVRQNTSPGGTVTTRAHTRTNSSGQVTRPGDFASQSGKQKLKKDLMWLRILLY